MVGRTTRHADDDDKEYVKLHLRIGHLSAHLKEFKKEILAKLSKVELKSETLPLECAALTSCNCSDKMKFLEAKVDDIFCQRGVLDCADKIFKLEAEIDSKVVEIFNKLGKMDFADKISMLETKFDSKFEDTCNTLGKIDCADKISVLETKFDSKFEDIFHKFGKIDCADKISVLESKFDSKVEDILNKLCKMDCADMIPAQEFEVIDDDVAVACQNEVQDHSLTIVPTADMNSVRERDLLLSEQDDAKFNEFMTFVRQKHTEDEDRWIERMEVMNDNIAVLREAVSSRDACIANLRASADQSPLVSAAPISTKQCENSQVAVIKAKPKKKR